MTAVVVKVGLATRQLESDSNPSQSLWVQIQTASSPQDYATLRKNAQEVLRGRPLDVRAASLLAAIDDQNRDHIKAEAMMRAAFDLNRRDTVVNIWLFNQEVSRSHYDQAFMHADILLRRRPELGRNLYPAMLQATGDSSAIKALAKRLAAGPFWRETFLATARGDGQRLDLTQQLLSEIKAAGGTLHPSEVSGYLQRLIQAKLYDQAYLNWLLFTPIDDISKLRNVYDGDFEGWPETIPFTWSFGPGVTGSIENAPNHGRALRIDYDGISSAHFPRQMMMLTPGRYNLTGEINTATPDGAHRIAWTVVCDEAEAPLLTSTPAVDTHGQWRKFSANFTVPADCKAQWLILTPTPGERAAIVEIWYDRIAVNPIEGPA